MDLTTKDPKFTKEKPEGARSKAWLLTEGGTIDAGRQRTAGDAGDQKRIPYLTFFWLSFVLFVLFVVNFRLAIGTECSIPPCV